MTSYLETARQIVDDEANLDHGSVLLAKTLVRVHKSLTQLEIQRTAAETVDGDDDDERIYFGDGV